MAVFKQISQTFPHLSLVSQTESPAPTSYSQHWLNQCWHGRQVEKCFDSARMFKFLGENDQRLAYIHFKL